MRPRTFTHWVVWAFEPGYARRLMQLYYGDPSTQPDFALLVYQGLSKRQHPWRRFEKNYRIIIDRRELGYVIEQRIGSR